jgi:hypothetical protein
MVRFDNGARDGQPHAHAFRLAGELNARGISTARGGSWHAMSVKNVLDRPIARKSQVGER